jgi:NAD(P)-dependent dehydrogenase (short-subunit alcohol dehydrogenase family)
MDLASHGVTCNAVLPGWVRTEMAERKAVQEAEQRGITTDAIWQERAASYPGGRLVTEEEVAEAITFLVSDRASGINGETITVTGGGLW